MAKKEAFYAVQNGHHRGVYSSWSECQAQTEGYSGAVFKKFDNAAAAQSFSLSNGGYGSRETVHSSSVGGSGSYGSGSGSRSSNSKPSYSKSSYESDYTEPSYSRSSYTTSLASGIKVEPAKTTKIAKPTAKSTAKSTAKPAKKAYYGANFQDGSSGIYNSWSECQSAVSGQKGVTFKKFDTLDAAETFTSSGDTVDTSTEVEKSHAVSRYLTSYSEQSFNNQKKAPVSNVFMDGSYLPIGQNGKCGYGVYFGPNDPRNLSEPVKGVDTTDSFIGEVHATRAALETIKQDITKFEAGKMSCMPKYVLSTDSETVIGILTKYALTWNERDFDERSGGKELKEAYEMYKDVQGFFHRHSEVFDNHEFEIKWVKGHSGVDGNEAADQLAKAGAMKS